MGETQTHSGIAEPKHGVCRNMFDNVVTPFSAKCMMPLSDYQCCIVVRFFGYRPIYKKVFRTEGLRRSTPRKTAKEDMERAPRKPKNSFFKRAIYKYLYSTTLSN